MSGEGVSSQSEEGTLEHLCRISWTVPRAALDLNWQGGFCWSSRETWTLSCNLVNGLLWGWEIYIVGRVGGKATGALETEGVEDEEEVFWTSVA